jgi:hypothetical protein
MKGMMATAAAWVLASTATPTQAQHIERAYISGAAGTSAIQTVCSDSRYNCSASATGGRVLGGLFVGNGLSVEAIYIDFGSGREFRRGQFSQVSLRMGGIGTALHLELGGGIAFVARGGLAGTRFQRDDPSGFSTSSYVTGVDGYVGFGGLFRVTRQLAIEASVDVLGLGDEQYRRDGGVMGSVGLSLRF